MKIVLIPFAVCMFITVSFVVVKYFNIGFPLKIDDVCVNCNDGSEIKKAQEECFQKYGNSLEGSAKCIISPPAEVRRINYGAIIINAIFWDVLVAVAIWLLRRVL